MLKQIKAKALAITKVLYLEYELLFIFDNAINYVIYAKDVLQVIYINKSLRVNNFSYKQGNMKQLMGK